MCFLVNYYKIRPSIDSLDGLRWWICFESKMLSFSWYFFMIVFHAKYLLLFIVLFSLLSVKFKKLVVSYIPRYLLLQVGERYQSCVKILIQQIASRVPDKTDYRLHASQVNSTFYLSHTCQPLNVIMTAKIQHEKNLLLSNTIF